MLWVQIKWQSSDWGKRSGGAASSQLFMGGIYGSPLPGISPEATLNGTWTVNGSNYYGVPPNQPEVSGSTLIRLNTTPNMRVGLSITDVTNPVIPDGTTITGIQYGAVTISNPTTGAMSLTDTLVISGSNNCMQLVAGMPIGGATGLIMDNGCGFSGGEQGLLFSYGQGFLYIPGGSTNVTFSTLNPVTIAALPVCFAGADDALYGTVSDGQTVAAAGYGAAVSTTGSTLRPVFCGGASGWIYH